MQLITSTQNPLVKEIAKIVKDSSVARQKSLAVFDGIHMAREAINHIDPEGIEKVFVLQDFDNVEIKEILDNVKSEKIIQVSSSVLEKISSTKNNQGILVLAKRPRKNNSKKYRYVVFLDQVADPGNVGTIIRTAVAMGFESVFISENSCDAWSAKCLRASQGAHLYLDVHEGVDLQVARNLCDGQVLVTELNESARSLYDCDLTQPTIWVFGNEGVGVSQSVVDSADQTVLVPMAQGFESLNVAVCAAVCLSEQHRQLLPVSGE